LRAGRPDIVRQFTPKPTAVHLTVRALRDHVVYRGDVIEAAGGVIWRQTRTLHVEVVVVHRPRRDDWSLPKGKSRRRESPLDCALREVREETGFRCAVGDELPEVRYVDRKGRDKRVRYWAMQPLDGTFRPNREVDAIEWVLLDQLHEVLSAARDLVVVHALQPLRAAVA
jgi:8-oxo-dGTP diphosphatase